MPIAKQLWYVGFGREVTPGTPVAATAFSPVLDIKPSDKYNYQPDKGIRGSFVEEYASIATQAWHEYSFDTDFFADIFGWYVKGLLGDEVVTGSTPGAGTTTSGTIAIGATTFSAVAATGFVTGGIVQVDVGVLTEVVQLGTVSGAGPFSSGTLANSQAFRFAHASGVAIVPVTAPYGHSFAVLNSGSGQPPTTSVTYYNGFNARTIPFGLFSELNIKYSADALVKVSGKLGGFKTATVTAPTKSFSTLAPQPSWRASATINSVATGLLESCDFDIKRGVVPVLAINGTQTPNSMWAQVVSVSGKATLIYESDAFLTLYTAGTPVPFDLALSAGSGVTAVGLQVHCTSAQFTKTDVMMGSKDYVQLDIDFRGEGSTTDAGNSGGSSNVNVDLTNAQMLPY